MMYFLIFIVIMVVISVISYKSGKTAGYNSARYDLIRDLFKNGKITEETFKENV